MTGYTYKVVEQNLSLKDFAITCAGAFLRFDGDKLPENYQVDDYYLGEIEKAKESYADLKLFTKEQKIDHVRKIYENSIKSNNESVDKITKENEILTNMIYAVQAWKPKSKILVDGLKKFMLEQLKSSLNDLSYYKRCSEESTPQTDKELVNYFNREVLAPAKKQIGYYKKRYQEEVKRTNEKNKWLSDLRKSLDNL